MMCLFMVVLFMLMLSFFFLFCLMVCFILTFFLVLLLGVVLFVMCLVFVGLAEGEECSLERSGGVCNVGEGECIFG